jgi:hypothetical protein
LQAPLVRLARLLVSGDGSDLLSMPNSTDDLPGIGGLLAGIGVSRWRWFRARSRAQSLQQRVGKGQLVVYVCERFDTICRRFVT